MPYVPPHLREGRADSAPPPPSNSFGRSNGPVSRDYGSSFGSRRDDRSNGAPASGGNSSRPSSRDGPLPGRDVSRRSAGPPEVVWETWKPSQRVFDLTPEQIVDVRKRLNIDVQVTPGTPEAPAAVESFGDIGLNSDIMKDITFHSYTNPTPIQAQAMPVALSGRDLLGCAETGSGKTAAFAIPMIQHCLAQPPVKRGDGPLALVLAPTRELAQQIEKEVRAFTRSSKGFKSSIVVGGTHMGDQASELRGGVELVVATPGRFIDHLHQGNTDLHRISFVVLDEADRMLDMGFEPQIREVMMGLPKRHQTLLFSATMPTEIETLAQEYLDKPVRVKVGTVSSPTANVTQSLEKIPEPQKLETLLALLVEEANAAESNQQPQPLTIVFVERKTKCDEVADALTAQGLRAVAIHGGRSQGEREAALRDFRKGDRNILVATDVASRGLDVSGVAHVINMDLPKTLEDYVHRIGRTGRAGASGRATSFHTERDAYLVAQIKRALAEVEAGNTMAFATGKAARAKEREDIAAMKSGSQVATGPSIVSVDDKFRHMLALSSTSKDKDKGVADDAWDD